MQQMIVSVLYPVNVEYSPVLVIEHKSTALFLAVEITTSTEGQVVCP